MYIQNKKKHKRYKTKERKKQGQPLYKFILTTFTPINTDIVNTQMLHFRTSFMEYFGGPQQKTVFIDVDDN